MPGPRTTLPGRSLWRLAGLLLAFGLAAGLLDAAAQAADEQSTRVDKADKAGALPPGLEADAPASLEDLKILQKQTKAVVAKVQPATVGLVVGGSSGSGVIIDAEGHILTAGHVSAAPDKDCTVIMPDGKRVKGKTLGMNRAIDSGMIKITEEGKWPFAEMGTSTGLKKGQWVISIGHPGGYKKGRSPVVRLGRIQDFNDFLIRTDCTLVGGDSGGPLFDMNGKVIGIHSRIGGTIATNIHVPVDTYKETWDRLAKGEAWGGRLGSRENNDPYLGLEFDKEAKDCKVADVTPDSPAAKAGLKVNDVITSFDGRKVASFDELKALIAKKKPGDEVAVEVTRDKETMTLKLKVGKRG
jgi:serine protease Do